MELSSKQTILYQTSFGANPSEADIAMVPINEFGSVGELNSWILQEFSYKIEALDSLNLKKGYDLLQGGLRPILFVVTISKSSFTANNLDENLQRCIEGNIKMLSGKKVWIPLMGTGDGGLTYLDSYEIISDVLQRIGEKIGDKKTLFIISIPENPEGLNLVNRLTGKRSPENDVGSGTIQQVKALLPGLTSDSDTGPDYLDINSDVVAFARVMSAKSFQPPLAIALLGKWGSGKSFFMKSLKRQIEALSDSESGGSYCNGIAHIQFNAWSYMDTNLWASIIVKIFEGLNEYISGNCVNDEKKNTERYLHGQLNITQEELAILKDRKDSITGQIEALNVEKEKVNEELKRKTKEIGSNALWNVISNVDEKFDAKEKIKSSLKSNYSFIKTESELKNIVPEEYWNYPASALNQVKSKIFFLKEFFRRDKIGWNLFWFSLIILLVIIIPVLLDKLTANVERANFALPESLLSLLVVGGVIWKRVESVYKKLQPLIASFWGIKEEYNKELKQKVAEFEEQEKAIRLEIEQGKSALILIDQQIQQATLKKVEIEFKINNVLSTEALYSFIDRKTKSEDYRKYLGIISSIRRDFEVLNNLFLGHNDEAAKNKDNEEFNAKFKKPLERIILYIDDLDRCPEDNVVQVLEAVNLLLAFPLFIVVVGVDPRWVKNALIKKHSIQLVNSFRDENKSEKELIEPNSYLEKIFQIPFHLKDAPDEDVKQMIALLAESQPDTMVLNKIQEKDSLTNSQLAAAVALVVVNQEREKEFKRKPELLVISDEEIGHMQGMSDIIGSNPRSIKRFVNTFRIIKAHKDFVYEGNNQDEPLIVIFLLAVSISCDKYISKLLSNYFEKDLSRSTSFVEEPFDLNDPYTTQKHHTLKRISDVLKNYPDNSLLKHYEFIKRFTF